MSVQIIDTQVIQNTAATLHRVNESIADKSRQTEASVKALGNSWRSPGGSAALSALDQIFRMEEPRRQVLENYITILERIINPNYLSAEDVNKKLASYFK